MAYWYHIAKSKRLPRCRLSVTIMLCMIGCGIGFLFINLFQLYHEFTSSGSVTSNVLSIRDPKLVWIYAKKNSHLKYLIRVFSYAGYDVTTSLTMPKRWDVMWAYDYPFKEHLKDSLMNLHYDQMVNHFPGTGFLTLKVELAKTKLPWIPKAFIIPDEMSEFHKFSTENQEKLWVQKSNNHRGIKIVSKIDMDFSAATSSFVQEFIHNPLLIDGRKFDIGVYVVVTSIDPLMVYIYEDDMLVRFCLQSYNPFDVKSPEKYIIGDRYTSVDQIPSLSKYFKQAGMSFKDSIFTHLQIAGYNTKKIWEEIKRSIAAVFISKAEMMSKALLHYTTKYNFFELVRVDYVIDETGKVWLMEINMSPNLSPSTHPVNTLMFQQVIYNTLSLVGIAHHIDVRFRVDAKEVVVSDHNIISDETTCASQQCLTSCNEKSCMLCNQCLDKEKKAILKKVYTEHHNKGQFSRILPYQSNPNDGEVSQDIKIERTEDYFLASWFAKKCLKQKMWCS